MLKTKYVILSVAIVFINLSFDSLKDITSYFYRIGTECTPHILNIQC